MRHYDHSYVVPGERFPRRAKTVDPVDRDVCDVTARRRCPAATSGWSATSSPPRATPSARARSTSARSCARSPTPTPSRSSGGPGGAGQRPRSSGTPTSGASRCACWGWSPGPWSGAASCPPTVPRRGRSGTLFPQSSRKTARAINAASGNRPLVVLANLSGFDGSPESMRRWQLEYGAEIGRAVTNFDGPIVFVVISRYHGGAFVVFSKRLNPAMEIAAIEGSYASVIGGAPAAATVFAREVRAAPTTTRGWCAVATRSPRRPVPRRPPCEPSSCGCTEEVRSEKLGEVADEFDARAHDPAGAVGRVGRPDHPGGRPAPVRRRRARARDGPHPRPVT